MIDDTPAITAREMSEILEQFQAGITASKMMTEHMESVNVNDPETAFYSGAWWALLEMHMAVERALGIREPAHCGDYWDRPEA